LLHAPKNRYNDSPVSEAPLQWWIHQGVLTPLCCIHQGVTTPWCEHTGESRPSCDEYTGESLLHGVYETSIRVDLQYINTCRCQIGPEANTPLCINQREFLPPKKSTLSRLPGLFINGESQLPGKEYITRGSRLLGGAYTGESRLPGVNTLESRPWRQINLWIFD
jgi:hypothetical protein